MHPKTNHKLLLLIQAALVSIFLAVLFRSQNIDEDVLNAPPDSLSGGFLFRQSLAANCSGVGGTCVYDRRSDSTVSLQTVAAGPESGDAGGAIFRLVNNCTYTIWPAIKGNPELIIPVFLLELRTGATRAIPTPYGWSGRFWGRTGCNFNDSGVGPCDTGDTIATLAEFVTGSGNGDFYDVSLVNGFNVPMRVDAVDGRGQCAFVGCVEDLIGMCLEELRTDDGGACRSACNAFNTTVHCCRGSTCARTQYSQFFKDACPLAYSLAVEDSNSIFTCRDADYVITFCAATIPTNISTFARRPSSPGPTSPGPSSPGPTSPGPSFQGRVREGSFPIGIATGVAVGVASTIVLVIIVIVCCVKRQHSSKGVLNHASDQLDIEKFLPQHGSLALKRYKYSEIKKITKSFNEKLGQGGYGSVYKGELPDKSLVDVKVLIDTDSNGEEFINEVASISRTSHVNIVNLLGFCYDRKKRALVYEFMPKKSLDKFLKNDCTLDLDKLYKIAVGVAKGLEYLHTGCNTRIVHFDIKPQNILLDDDFCPKISDFGLAKLGKKKQSAISMLGTRGTIGYIAPEVFSRNFGGVSYKSDVYSYGMMVLEMVGERKLDETETIQSSENYFPDRIYEHAIDFTIKLGDLVIEEEIEEETARKMILVGFWCIQTTPSNRPSMSKVVEMLEGSLQSIQIPPKPVLFTPPTLAAHEFSRQFSDVFSTTETENSADVLPDGAQLQL
ncbi:hypothetical protein ACP275_12G032600 [Erythranthe tilingii]